MRIDIISAVPSLLDSPLSNSIIGRAVKNEIVDIFIHDLREYSKDKHKKVDDYPYGGGAGMILTAQPVFSCIEPLLNERRYDEIIYTAPDGTQFNQAEANRLSVFNNIIILCGHYKGIDQRIRDALITKEYSVGDVVLSGGELPALLITDALVRLIPGAISDAESALEDSFQNGLLDAPAYTRPAVFKKMNVPEVLLSGDHKCIDKWRFNTSLEKTKRLRPDLYNKFKNEQ